MNTPNKENLPDGSKMRTIRQDSSADGLTWINISLKEGIRDELVQKRS
ncbi:hypothetical protein SAMN05216197_118105 [Pseudomonas graminis]|uniref:Uncharacterized protein n=1 Tax=Pseudomonas graminis TaxID=158627 RepID=A0A1I0G0U5_9PSED|nr:hypothetical protein SAMN05216197_118105 [Pseudomonas graminis]